MKLIVLLATIATAHAGLRGLQATLDLDEDEMKVYVNNLGEMTDEDYAGKYCVLCVCVCVCVL